MTNLSAIAAEFIDDSAAAPLSFTHSGSLWRWKSTKTDAPAAWFFVAIDGEAGQAIAASTGVRGGFASLRVEVRVGQTVWRTSVFPSKEPPGFLLPVKAAVRKAEALEEGDAVLLQLTLI